MVSITVNIPFACFVCSTYILLHSSVNGYWGGGRLGEGESSGVREGERAHYMEDLSIEDITIEKRQSGGSLAAKLYSCYISSPVRCIPVIQS